MRVSGADFGPYRQWRDAILMGLLLVCFSAVPTRAQDVAEAARQQKAAKQAEPKAPSHVYTEEDLKRHVILTPEDQVRLEARRKQQFTMPSEQNAQQLPNDDQQGESLGEIARRYRLEKASREAELALKNRFTAFPYEIPTPVLAAPAPPVGPLTPSAFALPIVDSAKPLVPASSPNAWPRLPHARERLSPFQPRPLSETGFPPPAGLLVVPGPPLRPSVMHPIEPRITHEINTNTHVQPGQSSAALPAGKRVHVEPGQSWWKLAELYLGNGALWPELRKRNQGLDGPPDLLQAGTTVVVPDVQKTMDPAKINPNPTSTVTVQKGDSLWSLARKYLRRGSSWIYLAQANPEIVDFTHLAIGTRVQLPSQESAKSSGETPASR